MDDIEFSDVLLTVEANVSDYFCTAEEDIFDNHMFKVKVSLGPQRLYSLLRSYSSFCELDAILRRKYPRSTIPTLPLAEAQLFVRKANAKAIESDSPLQNAKSSASDIRASMQSRVTLADAEATKSKSKPKRRKDMSEVISSKLKPLDKYLQSLLKLPEILLSENLVNFFDEQSADGEPVPTITQDVNEMDILLADETPKTQTIRQYLKIPIDTDVGSIVLWEFSTKYHDIGFSVSFDEKEVVAYQRHNSHIKPVRGCLDIQSKGVLVLSWDNKYSKMRSKQLTYTAVSTTKGEYLDARAKAQDTAKERQLFLQQRAQLKRALMNTSQEKLSSARNATALSILPSDALMEAVGDYEGEGGLGMGMGRQRGDRDRDELEEELAKLRDEKRSLQMALAAAESMLVAERSACAENFDRMEDSAKLKRDMERELAAVKADLERQGLGGPGIGGGGSGTRSGSMDGRDTRNTSSDGPGSWGGGGGGGGVGSLSFSDDPYSPLPANVLAPNTKHEQEEERTPKGGDHPDVGGQGGSSSPFASASFDFEGDYPSKLDAALISEEFFLAEEGQGGPGGEGGGQGNAPDVGALLAEVETLRARVEEELTAREGAEERVRQLKQEKKQLKGIALKLRSDLEAALAEADALRVQLEHEVHEKQLVLAERAQAQQAAPQPPPFPAPFVSPLLEDPPSLFPLAGLESHGGESQGGEGPRLSPPHKVAEDQQQQQQQKEKENNDISPPSPPSPPAPLDVTQGPHGDLGGQLGEGAEAIAPPPPPYPDTLDAASASSSEPDPIPPQPLPPTQLQAPNKLNQFFSDPRSTGAGEEMARNLLDSYEGDVDAALEAHYEMRLRRKGAGGPGPGPGRGAHAPLSKRVWNMVPSLGSLLGLDDEAPAPAPVPAPAPAPAPAPHHAPSPAPLGNPPAPAAAPAGAPAAPLSGPLPLLPPLGSEISVMEGVSAVLTGGRRGKRAPPKGDRHYLDANIDDLF